LEETRYHGFEGTELIHSDSNGVKMYADKFLIGGDSQNYGFSQKSGRFNFSNRVKLDGENTLKLQGGNSFIRIPELQYRPLVIQTDDILELTAKDTEIHSNHIELFDLNDRGHYYFRLGSDLIRGHSDEIALDGSNSHLRLRDGNFLVRSDHNSIRSAGDTTVASENGTIYLDAMDGNLITYSNELSHKIRIEDLDGNTWHNDAFLAYAAKYNHPTNGGYGGTFVTRNPLWGDDVLCSDYWTSDNREYRCTYLFAGGSSFIDCSAGYTNGDLDYDDRNIYGSDGYSLIESTLDETKYFGLRGDYLITADILGVRLENIPETSSIDALYGMDADGYLHSISIANLKTLLSA
jgi:hypothetical protein